MSFKSKQEYTFNDYEAFAEAYAKRTESNSYNAYYERPAMLSLLPDVKGKRILDAGCTGVELDFAAHDPAHQHQLAKR